jgi:hypothetical protein
VAKLLEEAGLFVPAYKGGFMKDIDLMATNDSNEAIDLGGLHVPSRMTRTIQVKLHAEKLDLARGNADFLITGSPSNQSACFGRDWLNAQLNKSPRTSDWFHRSTKWADSYLATAATLA